MLYLNIWGRKPLLNSCTTGGWGRYGSQGLKPKYKHAQIKIINKNMECVKNRKFIEIYEN